VARFESATLQARTRVVGLLADLLHRVESNTIPSSTSIAAMSWTTRARCSARTVLASASFVGRRTP
jgi:hypothetical protein